MDYDDSSSSPDFYFHHQLQQELQQEQHQHQQQQKALRSAAHQQHLNQLYYKTLLEPSLKPKPSYPSQNTNSLHRQAATYANELRLLQQRRHVQEPEQKHEHFIPRHDTTCNGSDLINDNNNYFVTNYNNTTTNNTSDSGKGGYYTTKNQQRGASGGTVRQLTGKTVLKSGDDRHLYHKQPQPHFDYSYGVKQVFIDSNPINTHKMQKEEMMIERSQLVNNESTNVPNDLDNTTPNVGGVGGGQPPSGTTTSGFSFSLHRSHHFTQVSRTILYTRPTTLSSLI